MDNIDLNSAQAIIKNIREAAQEKKLKPLSIALFDMRGVLKAFIAEDRSALRRGQFAMAKGYGVICTGLGSRSLAKRALANPDFLNTASQVMGSPLLSMMGGVLIRSQDGSIIGSIGVSGDSAENDEAVAIVGVVTAGFVADVGED